MSPSRCPDALLTALLKILVVPPGMVLVPGLFGIIVFLRWRRLGALMVVASLVTLWFISMPWSAAFLARKLEQIPPVELSDLKSSQAEAILVLGGGANYRAVEYNSYDDVSRLTMERLRYAARLHRVSGLDLAVTGGAPGGTSLPEGAMMRTVLSADFRVPVRWAELSSNNTAENARFSRELFPFTTIVLVTHAVHMPRAQRAFLEAGFDVIPAPMGFIAGPESDYSLFDFFPDIKALEASHYVIYEFIGGLWYQWRQSG